VSLHKAILSPNENDELSSTGGQATRLAMFIPNQPGIGNRPMTERAFIKICGLFTIGFLLTTALSPNFKISGALPTVRAEDLLTVFGALFLLLNRKGLPRARGAFQWGIVYLFAVSCISLVLNGNIFIFSDSIELYKYVKLFTVCVFAYHGAPYVFSHLKYCGPFLLLLALLNVIQYFGLFSFNETLALLYSPQDQLAGFAESAPNNKRLLGLMGNPNVNAAFWFLAMIFTASADIKYKTCYIALCALLIVGTQSRGMIVGAASVALVYFLHARINGKRRIYIICTASIFVYLLLVYAAPYLNYIGAGMNEGVLEDDSFTIRIEVWNRLWELAKERPLFGYGGGKQYFYDNGIYPDNEYILYIYRWGFAGLVCYCLLYWQGVKSVFFSGRPTQWIGLSSIGLIFSAVFNVPLTDPRVSIIYAALMGLLAQRDKEGKEGKRRTENVPTHGRESYNNCFRGTTVKQDLTERSAGDPSRGPGLQSG
jgi:O-antigen ligase